MGFGAFGFGFLGGVCAVRCSFVGFGGFASDWFWWVLVSLVLDLRCAGGWWVLVCC